MASFGQPSILDGFGPGDLGSWVYRFGVDYYWRVLKFRDIFETSLLRRLQAQTLPDSPPPIGKIPSFSEMTVTFEPLHYRNCDAL